MALPKLAGIVPPKTATRLDDVKATDVRPADVKPTDGPGTGVKDGFEIGGTAKAPASPDMPPASSSSGVLDGVQGVLDVAGFVPGVGIVADLANAGISAARGDFAGAALNAAAAIPGFGDAAKGAAMTAKVTRGLAAHAGDAKKAADGSADFKALLDKPLRLSDDAASTAKTATTVGAAAVKAATKELDDVGEAVGRVAMRDLTDPARAGRAISKAELDEAHALGRKLDTFALRHDARSLDPATLERLKAQQKLVGDTIGDLTKRRAAQLDDVVKGAKGSFEAANAARLEAGTALQSLRGELGAVMPLRGRLDAFEQKATESLRRFDTALSAEQKALGTLRQAQRDVAELKAGPTTAKTVADDLARQASDGGLGAARAAAEKDHAGILKAIDALRTKHGYEIPSRDGADLARLLQR